MNIPVGKWCCSPLFCYLMLFSCKFSQFTKPLCFLRWHSVESKSYLSARTQMLLPREKDIKKSYNSGRGIFQLVNSLTNMKPWVCSPVFCVPGRAVFPISQHAEGGGKGMRSSNPSWARDLIHKREEGREEGEVVTKKH